MQILVRLFVLSLCALLLPACSMLAKNYVPDEIMISSPSTYITKEGQIDLSLAGIPGMEGEQKQKDRAWFIANVVAQSDKKCEIHNATVLSNANSWNVSTGVASILFSGYAAVATNAANAANAAAAAAATTGIQGQVNQEVYQGKLATAVLRAIDVARSKAFIPVQVGIDDKYYSPAQMVTDLSRYHSSCSLMVGLTELTKALENRKPTRDELALTIANLSKDLGNPKLTNKTELEAELNRLILARAKTGE